jgi:hypothetical protein
MDALWQNTTNHCIQIGKNRAAQSIQVSGH